MPRAISSKRKPQPETVLLALVQSSQGTDLGTQRCLTQLLPFRSEYNAILVESESQTTHPTSCCLRPSSRPATPSGGFGSTRLPLCRFLRHTIRPKPLTELRTHDKLDIPVTQSLLVMKPISDVRVAVNVSSKLNEVKPERNAATTHAANTAGM